MTEHTTVNVLPSANPVNLTGRPGFVTTPPGTHYVAGPSVTSSSCGASDCIGGTIFTIYGLSALVSRIAALGFFITGCIFLAEENPHIPSCASHYKGWAIAMTVLFGLTVFKNDNKSESGSSSGGASGVMALIGCAMSMMVLVSGLIAGLGYRDVYDKTPDTCDVSKIPQLITWTEWILCYYLTLFSCFTFCLLLLGIMSRLE